VPYAPTDIFFTDAPINELGKMLNVFINNINGSRLIGEMQPLFSFGFGPDFKQYMLSGTCEREGAISNIRFRGKGHVEFDHQFQIEWSCKDRKINTYLTEFKPGESAKTIQLECRAHQ
jgi:hypothetical protein